MQLVRPDARLAELAYLDVVDVTADGQVVLNGEFRAICIAAYDQGALLDDVFQDCILARAMQRGFVGCIDLDDLALAALEIGAAEAEA